MKRIVLLCMLQACSHSDWLLQKNGEPKRMCQPPMMVAVTHNIPRHWDEDIQSGFEYWNEATGKEIFIWAGRKWWENDTHATRTVNVRISDIPTKCAQAAHYPQDRCFEVAQVDVILLCGNGLTPGKSRVTLFRHEAGHVLGLSHSDFQLDLMYPQILKGRNDPVDAHEQTIRKLKERYAGESR